MLAASPDANGKCVYSPPALRQFVAAAGPVKMMQRVMRTGTSKDEVLQALRVLSQSAQHLKGRRNGSGLAWCSVCNLGSGGGCRVL